MASSAAPAPSTQSGPLQTAVARARLGIEVWLEAERDQLFIWLPVAVGLGVALWFVLPGPRDWAGSILAAFAVAATSSAIGRSGARAPRAIMLAALGFAAGLGLIWAKAERVAAPVLARPVFAEMIVRIERVIPLPARAIVRVEAAPVAWLSRAPAAAPDRIRVNIAEEAAPAGLQRGALLRFRARLMPPAPPAVPGAYDFARVAWFRAIGASGRALDPVIVAPGVAAAGAWRERLSASIHASLPGSAGGIAAALATGDTGGIADADAEAMRRAGLAHLLSVSGLHLTAVVGIVMMLAMRTLALNMTLARTGRIPLLAAGIAAVAAVGYTALTGAEVPTVRACIAALLVLAAMAAGREAVTLRLVATGALIVLILWPESLAGPSFQLSFAAVTAIIALHESPRVRGWFAARDEGVARRVLRTAASLLLTGLVVEVTLMPIAAYHFHKAGIYGAVANIVAIPLTTFVIMPIEALALLFDGAGLGAPFWWLAGRMLALLLWLAHVVAIAPGSVAMVPAMPGAAFALMIGGGLWLALWRTRWRRAGLVPIVLGAAWALATPAPDLLVTGDGRHLALRTANGLAILRDRAGDYVRDTLAESGGIDGEMLALSAQAEARCSRDLCVATRDAGGRRWRIVATRSGYLLPWRAMIAACRKADIVVSDRRLPRACTPRWLALDRAMLARTGGVAITLARAAVTTVRTPGDHHPWVTRAISRSGAAGPKAFPARAPGRERNAADHRRGSPDRAGSSRPHAGNI